MNRIHIIAILISTTFTAYSQEAGKTDPTRLITDSIELTKVVVSSEFEEGKNGWAKFLDRNLNLDVPYFNSAPPGVYRVVIRFVVYKDGTVGDFKPLTKYGYGMEKEVIRVLKLSPKWKPAFQEGQYVDSYRNQPVKFVVKED